MKKLLKELMEQANELIDFGNSNEKAQGQGMLEVIEQVQTMLNTKGK